MIWRSGYATRRMVDVPVDLDKSGVFLVAFTPLAHTELGIWMRLLDDAFGPESYRICWITGGASKLERDVRAMFPPSVLKKTDFLASSVSSWTEKFEVEDQKRVIALVCVDKLATLAMIGPPTEEAWDDFQSAAKSGLNLA